jgi:leucyl/phenylalanyl-tRNA---protein transferase
MIWLSNKIEFPSYETATKDGVIALGGDLSIDRLLYAYHRGIFPWYSDGEPIVWHSPIERMVLFPDELKISKSMRQILNKGEFIITENKAFEEVIFYCKNIARNDEFGTWITDEMEQAYIQLQKAGVAKSIEIWQVTERSQSAAKRPTELVGGLYGLEIGDIFCGESMFSKVSNASKVAFIHLVQSEKYQLIDCQVYNEHLASLGAREISRDEFLKFLE